MEEEEYRNEIASYFKIIQMLKPHYILVDAQQGEYSIVPETQEWIAKNYAPIYRQIGLKKLALLMSKDIFAQVSFEQFFEEDKFSGFSLKYFNNKTSALSWLNTEMLIIRK